MRKVLIGEFTLVRRDRDGVEGIKLNGHRRQRPEQTTEGWSRKLQVEIIIEWYHVGIPSKFFFFI